MSRHQPSFFPDYVPGEVQIHATVTLISVFVRCLVFGQLLPNILGILSR
uniref:Uncharacterized protein n=1 Tax=Arundo donax TaxID=35708 RepID=A0A0A9F2D9_ARUDO